MALASALGAEEPLAERSEVTGAIELLDLWLEEQVAWQRVPGLVVGVVHGPELVWSKGYGVADLETKEPVTPRTLFRAGSVTKLFTATAVMQLRDAGKLRLDDPVASYLPWFELQNPFDGAPPVTVRHLLTHTSGLPREGAFPYWTTHDFPTLDEIETALPGQELIAPPGEKYQYSNLGIAVLGALVARVSGEAYKAYVERHILAPLGMASTTLAPSEQQIERLAAAYMRREPDGSRRLHTYYPTRAIAPAANLVSNLEDLARFASLHLADPAEEGGAVLDRYTRAEMSRPHVVYESWSGGRGLGFAVSREAGKTFVLHGGWIGGHRAHLLLAPGERIGVIVLTNAEDVRPAFFARRAYDLVGKAVAGAATPAAAPEPPAEAGWQRYLGTYSDPWGWEYRVRILDDKLVVYESSYPPVDDPESALTRLEPVEGEPHTFRMEDGSPLVFELDGAGRVERIRRRYEYIFPVAPDGTIQMPEPAAVGE